jgi:hypothetical protein
VNTGPPPSTGSMAHRLDPPGSSRTSPCRVMSGNFLVKHPGRDRGRHRRTGRAPTGPRAGHRRVARL